MFQIFPTVKRRPQPVIQIFVPRSAAGDIDLLIKAVHVQIVPSDIVQLILPGMPEIIFLDMFKLARLVNPLGRHTVAFEYPLQIMPVKRPAVNIFLSHDEHDQKQDHTRQHQTIHMHFLISKTTCPECTGSACCHNCVILIADCL